MPYNNSISRLVITTTLALLLSCSGEEEEMNMSPNDGEGPMISIENKGPSPCFPEIIATITTTSTDNTIASILWSGPNDFSSDQLTIQARAAGTYTITATDQAGLSTSESISIEDNEILNDPPSVVIQNLGLNEAFALILEAQITPSTADVTNIIWSTTETSASITVDSVGRYTVTVEDACGLMASASIDVTATDLSPYEGVWKALSVNASITTTVDGTETQGLIKDIVLNYTLNLESPNWTTMGNYQFEIEVDNQNVQSEVREVMGSGTYMIEDNLLTIDQSFFEYNDGMTSMSEMQTAVLHIDEQGRMVVGQTLLEDRNDNNVMTTIRLESESIWERQ